MVLKMVVTLLESLWVWLLYIFHHIWEDKELMNALKEVLQTILKTKLPIKSKKISNDQELIQSDPISCPQNQKGNN